MATETQKQQLAHLLEERSKLIRENRLLGFKPHPKQFEFFELGLAHRERAFIAANRVGKSLACCAELAMHLTGVYPDWWPGRRFNHPIVAWGCSESATFARDVMQAKLFGEGPPRGQMWGTGLIPKKSIIETSASHGAPNAIDQGFIKHISGGISTLAVKSYQAGREVFQGQGLHVASMDEESPMDIYAETLTRLLPGGVIFSALTPLKGRTALVKRFMDEPSPDRAYVKMGLEDALHYSAEERAIMAAGYLPHEREARLYGTPKRGEGWVWEGVEEANLVENLRLSDVPSWWTKLWGIDFGFTHPFAAVLLAYDRDVGAVHVIDAFRIKGGTPVVHADRMRSICASAPVAWPRDGDNVEKSTGEDLIESYRHTGLKLLPMSARHATGGVSVWAGIQQMREMMDKGRFKVASHLTEFWDEWRNYHVEDGKIVKVDDDLMDACRYGIMSLKHASEAPFGSQVVKRERVVNYSGNDDFWGFDQLPPRRY